MPIAKINASQFQAQMRSDINAKAPSHDTGFGPIVDVMINPVSTVLESQNDRVRQLSLLLSLVNGTSFDDTDLEDFVFNEGLLRNTGDSATVVEIFSSSSPPGGGVQIARGYPMGSVPDQSSGVTVTFVASQTVSGAAAVLNRTTGRYELQVPMTCTTQGVIGQLGANTITRPLRALNFFDSAFNRAGSTGGRDVETNAELIERYMLAIQGRQWSTPTGAEKFVRDKFAGSIDALSVFGNDPLLTRAASDAAAVDVYVVGTQSISITENLTFLGIGQVMSIANPPLISIDQVVGSVTFNANDDYDVVYDQSGAFGSTRAIEGIRFRPAGTNLSSYPTPGAAVAVTYTYNNLVRAIQARNDNDRDVRSMAQDRLYKQAAQVSTVIVAALTLFDNINFSDVVEPAATAAVLNLVNTNKLGNSLTLFNLETTLGAITGIKNVKFLRLTPTTIPAGVDDIVVASDARTTLDPANLTLTQAI